MPTSTPCEECEAILLEHKRAYLDFWLNAREETRDACRAIGQLIAWGSEADVARAQELLRPFKPSNPVNAEGKMGSSQFGFRGVSWGFRGHP